MERIVHRVHSFVPAQPKATRVAAYARVSSGKDAMLHSLSAQVSYYNDLIQKHNGWLFCGVYADEAITGTKEDRDGFQRLLAECRAGNIDLIIVKSISRLARNTVTLLKTVRELKQLGVNVYFEEQNIYTMSADGELMMTILASYAQEESLSVSENMKWRVRHNFENGMPWNGTMLGYRYEQGTLMVVPEEAAVVQYIFEECLSGRGVLAIAKQLNEDKVATRFGNEWNKNSVMRVLRNYAYTGNLLLQKFYRKDHLTKKDIRNSGELPQYHVTDSHEAIVSLEAFNAVQALIAERAEKFCRFGEVAPAYPFTGKLVCDICGKHYQRRKTKNGYAWICATFRSKGKAACASKQIPEATLCKTAAEVLGVEEFDADAFIDKITAVRVRNGNTLEFTFTNGKQAVKQWQDRSRSESWTAEMRAAVGRKNLERSKNYGGK